jgi:hypothetical protein
LKTEKARQFSRTNKIIATQPYKNSLSKNGKINLAEKYFNHTKRENIPQ